MTLPGHLLRPLSGESVTTAHEDWRSQGEGGWWLLRCVNGHVWRAREAVPGVADGRRGDMTPAECPRCGEKGELDG